jgi:hypothetical protein
MPKTDKKIQKADARSRTWQSAPTTSQGGSDAAREVKCTKEVEDLDVHTFTADQNQVMLVPSSTDNLVDDSKCFKDKTFLEDFFEESGEAAYMKIDFNDDAPPPAIESEVEVTTSPFNEQTILPADLHLSHLSQHDPFIGYANDDDGGGSYAKPPPGK